MLKFRFLLIGLLAALVMRGQVDSFRVEGKYYDFNLPVDWTLDYKSDSIVDSKNWNVQLSYAIKEHCLHASIFLGIKKTEVLPTMSAKERKKLNRQTPTVKDCDELGFYGEQYTFHKPYSGCVAEEYTIYRDYMLNDSLYLSIAINCTGNKQELPTLLNPFYSFATDFLSLNNKSLTAFDQRYHYVGNEFIDTLNYKDEKYAYRSLVYWKRESKRDHNQFTHEVGPCGHICIDVFACEPPTQSNYSMRTENLFVEKHMEVISSCYVQSYFSIKPSALCGTNYNQYELYYYVYMNDATCVCFGLTVDSANNLLFRPYKDLTISMVKDFITRNKMH